MLFLIKTVPSAYTNVTDWNDIFREERMAKARNFENLCSFGKQGPVPEWREKYFHFLGELAKLRKATISFVMSIRMEKLDSHWTDFHEIWDLSVFLKSVEKIKVSWKPGKNNRYFTWRRTFMRISRYILLKTRNVWDKSCKNNQNTHFVLNTFFSFSKIIPFIMRKKML